MEKAIRYFAINGRVTYLLTILILLAGAISAYTLRRESFPTVDFATMSIATVYPGASPEEVEDLITIPLEDELRTVEGFDKVISVSQQGQSEITIQVELDGYVSDDVMDEAQRAIQRARLPADLQDPPTVVRVSSGEIPVFELGVIGDTNGRQRNQIAEDLQDVLEDAEGVANVRFNGYQNREFQVLVDQQKMRNKQIALEEVNRMLQNHLKDVPGGYIENSSGTEKLVRVRGKIEDPKEIENLIVRGTYGGGQVRIGDIARVIDTSAEPEVITRLNSKPATLLTVTKKVKADTITTVNNIEKEIENFKSRIPEGYEVRVYTNEAKRVEADLYIVQFNAVLGLVLILIVLMILLPGTIGIVASMSIPLIILSLTFGMVAMGLTFNSITMIAAVIVLGLLVDNSAVVAEGYAHNRALGMEPVDSAVKSAHSFFIPIVATILCNFAGFAPMLVTTGIMGQFIYSIPVVITIALAFSLVETFFLLPARLKRTLKKHHPRPPAQDSFEVGWFGNIQRKFNRLLIVLVRRRYVTMLSISALFISSIFVSAFLNRFELFPSDNTEWYVGRFEVPLGTSVKKTDEAAQNLSGNIVKALEQNKVKFNGVVSFSGVSRIDAFDPQGRRAHNVGFVLVTIPEDESMRISARWLVSEFKKVSPPEGVAQIRWTELANGPPVGRPLNLIFRSADGQQLRSMVKEFKEQLSQIPGTENVEDDLYRTSQELTLNLNEDLLRRANLSVSQVGEAVQTALQGTVVSKLNLRSREVLMRVRYESVDRSDLGNVENISIPTTEGGYMKLGTLAQIQEIPGPENRKRYDFHQAVTVSADVKEGQLTSVEINSKAREIIAKLETKYPQVNFVTSGEEESTQESMVSLSTALLISIFAILGILVIVYQSYGQAMLVLSTIPLGLAGVSYVFWIAQIPLSFMALIGVIGLGGVVVNASIVLVSFINDAKNAQPDRNLIELVSEVTALRFKAVFITNATTIMGLIPTAYGIGGDDPFLMPLTLAMGWGLLLGSALAIVWVPAGYLVLQDIHNRIHRRRISTA